ncbi:hypothetical protein ATANTOWER_020059 [Ataeniobius toweri]|uniref:Uncharacterized protein n=1 Tax=Ataeniobius toweri TaxID=208326 RepID=A0ABU7AS55_9TELE|nr:hypothetical protein [Ataeniobius toweri]
MEVWIKPSFASLSPVPSQTDTPPSLDPQLSSHTSNVSCSTLPMDHSASKCLSSTKSGDQSIKVYLVYIALFNNPNDTQSALHDLKEDMTRRNKSEKEIIKYTVTRLED